MASLEDALVPIPKKRITTYGKAVRGRRVQNFAPRIQTSEKKHNALFTPSLPPVEPKSKPPPKRPSPSATESSSGNVFDVPSTDDEATPAVTNIHKPVTKLASKTKTQKPLPSKDLSGPVSATEESGRNKRVKLSPPTKSEKSTLSTSKDLHNPFKTGHTTTMASRPKQMVPVQRKPELPNTPRKPSPSSKIVASSEPPALQNDPDMMDIDLPSSYVSPKGQQMWKELLDPVDTDGVASLATKTSVSRYSTHSNVICMPCCRWCSISTPNSSHKAKYLYYSRAGPVNCCLEHQALLRIHSLSLRNFHVEDSSILWLSRRSMTTTWKMYRKLNLNAIWAQFPLKPSWIYLEVKAWFPKFLYLRNWQYHLAKDLKMLGQSLPIAASDQCLLRKT